MGIPYSLCQKKLTFLVGKFDIRNGFSVSFPFQKCLLIIHHSFSLQVTMLSILQNFWVDRSLKKFLICCRHVDSKFHISKNKIRFWRLFNLLTCTGKTKEI